MMSLLTVKNFLLLGITTSFRLISSWEGVLMNWLNLDYDKAPIIIGALYGLLITAAILLVVFLSCLHLFFGPRGVAAVSGFIILPVFILTGMPWSILPCLIAILFSFELSKWMFILVLIGIINGNLLNGALIGASFGALFGLIKKFLLCMMSLLTVKNFLLLGITTSFHLISSWEGVLINLVKP